MIRTLKMSAIAILMASSASAAVGIATAPSSFATNAAVAVADGMDAVVTQAGLRSSLALGGKLARSRGLDDDDGTSQGKSDDGKGHDKGDDGKGHDKGDDGDGHDTGGNGDGGNGDGGDD